MSSSLGLLSGYQSDSSDSDSFEMAPKAVSTTVEDSSTQSTSTDRKTSLTDDSSSPVEGHSYFDADSNREEETSTSSEEQDSPDVNTDENLTLPTDTLPLPQLSKIHSGIVEALPGSVFSNPYKEAEESKRLVLEHHVSLAPEVEKKEKEVKLNTGRGKRRRQQMRDSKGSDLFDDRDSSVRTNKVNRTKVGVASGLVPSQKYMKLHEQQQAKERPWTLKK